MASSDNLAAIEPWMFRSPLTDSWIPDAFARETESALTKALQQSLYCHPDALLAGNHHPISPSFTASTVTGQSGSGSDPETPGSRRRGNTLGVATGKAAKRKSRAGKRSMTTFIQTDAANFRQMVQKVTGGNGHVPVSTVMKPEPHRQAFISNRFLPTLDTSEYLINRQVAVSGANSVGLSQAPPSTTGFVAEQGGFESFSNFPTLESWN